MKNLRKRKEAESGPGDLGAAIGLRLARFRQDRDELQADFAEGIDLSQSAMSLYERGLIPRSWLILRRMIEEKGVDANWLLTGKRNGR